jgi:hypothetical protein
MYKVDTVAPSGKIIVSHFFISKEEAVGYINNPTNKKLTRLRFVLSCNLLYGSKKDLKNPIKTVLL